MQLDGLNTALSPVVYGDIALSINTQYNTILRIPSYCKDSSEQNLQQMSNSSNLEFTSCSTAR